MLSNVLRTRSQSKYFKVGLYRMNLKNVTLTFFICIQFVSEKTFKQVIFVFYKLKLENHATIIYNEKF